MSKTREWFRSYSSRLKASFSASGLIEHRVTKGSSREAQVLDVLSALLPLRISVLRDGVIIDSSDTESPKFDALLVDRQFWPLLFEQDTVAVAMLESVLAAVEIKSSLESKDLTDIINKSSILRTMRCAGKGTTVCPPVVVAFAYECPNLSLAFYDFAVNFRVNPTKSPSLVCTLSSGLLFLARPDGAALVPTDVPTAGLVPAIASAGEDSLLIFLYFLSRLAALGSDTVDTMLSYSIPVFAARRVHHFDDDFLSAVAGDDSARQRARECFKRTQSAPFEQLYRDARSSLKLPVAGS